MIADWPLVSIEEITTKLGDGLHGTPEYDDKGVYYFINGNNLSNGKIVVDEKTKKSNKEEYLKHKKDLNGRTILVSINGTLGNIALYNNEKVFLGKSACYFNVKENVDKQYVRYVISSSLFQNYIHSLATGSTIKNVSLKLMREFSFRLPPIEIQRKISKVLKELDDKIELNRQANQTLEHIAQAIFKSWFVDFEPTRAKIAAIEAGECPERAAMAVISGCSLSAAGAVRELDQLSPEQQAQLKTTAALFPDALVDSELGEVPKGWSIESIYDIADVIYGAPFKSTLFNDKGEGLPLVRIRDLKHERPGVCTPEVNKKGYMIQNGDLLVGMDGEFRPYIWGGNQAWMNQRVCAFKPKRGLSAAIVREFIKRQLMFLELTAVATTVIHLGKGDIDGFTYLETNNELLMVCSDFLEPIFQRIVSNKVECISLEEARDSLLPKLLSGELAIETTQTELEGVG